MTLRGRDAMGTSLVVLVALCGLAFAPFPGAGAFKAAGAHEEVPVKAPRALGIEWQSCGASGGRCPPRGPLSARKRL